MPEDDIVIYMDESGNSGSNILDHDQPVFCIAAFVFRKQSMKLVEILIKKAGDLARSGRYTSAEVKFSLFTSPRHFKIFENLMEQIKKNCISLCYSVIYKDFFSGMMMVEYLIDSAYNPHVPNHVFQIPHIKQNMANQFCKYIPATIRQNFINALKSCDENSLLSAKEEIDRHIDDYGLKQDQFSWVLRLDRKDYLECTFVDLSHFPDHCSPNFHAFSMQIGCLSRLFMQKKLGGGKLFFDEQREYQKSFALLTKSYNSSEEKYIPHPYDSDRGFTIGPFFNGEIEFLNSSSTSGIQSADLAAASCNWLLKKRLIHGEVPMHTKTYEKKLTSELLHGIVNQTSYLAQN